jgi:capsular polysaccharide biosynthesis protein
VTPVHPARPAAAVARTEVAPAAPLRDVDDAPPPPPPIRGPLESLLRHPRLVLVPVILLVAAAIAVGLLRTPVFKAEARINVGRADVPAYTLQGVTIGNATLAASYARALAAPSVLQAGAKAAGLTTAEARERLSGSQVPRSTLIRVEGQGSTNREARRLANGSAAGLIRYVTKLNARQQDTGLLGRYRRAQRETDRQRRRVASLTRRNGARSRVVERARLDLLTAQLRSQTLSTRVVQNGEQPMQNLLQLVVPATHATSDRTSVLSRLVLIALAAGILIGLALALLRTNADLLRRTRENLATRRQ